MCSALSLSDYVQKLHLNVLGSVAICVLFSYNITGQYSPQLFYSAAACAGGGVKQLVVSFVIITVYIHYPSFYSSLAALALLPT